MLDERWFATRTNAGRDVRAGAGGVQDHGPGRSRRRVGRGRALHPADPHRDGPRQERPGDQRHRRGRHCGPRSVRQRRQGRPEPAHGQRDHHGRRDPDQQGAGDARPGHPHRPPHGRPAGDRRARELAPQDGRGPCGGREGRYREGDVGGRFRWRRRPHPGGAVHQGGGIGPGQGQLRRLVGRRRGLGRHARRLSASTGSTPARSCSRRTPPSSGGWWRACSSPTSC